MTYWEWFWINSFYELVTSVAVILLYGVGYFVWKMWIEDWAENRSENRSDKKHYRTLLDK